MAQEFKHLFSPIKIGSMTVKNRIYSSPHAPGGYTDPETNLFGKRIHTYWATKAKGGVGMIGTQVTEVHPIKERNIWYRPRINEALKGAADAVHQYGAKLISQISYMAAQSQGYNMPTAWAPSAVPTPNGQMQLHTPHEMTTEEVKAFVAAFGHAAGIARGAGVDGIEIHGAHGYLLTEFMSSFTNTRTDEYGGSLENRMRFPLEIIEAMRKTVGRDFPIGMRIIADEFVVGGYTLDDFLQMVVLLTKTGQLDYINVSVGVYRSTGTIFETMYYPLNSFVYCAAAIKQVVDIPVITRGRVTDPVQAEQILANNQADMVSMVRAIIADPELPNKAREGRLEEIRKCIGCNEACWGNNHFSRGQGGGMSCTMNPAVGKEWEAGWGELIPATVKKRVMVIGGGPAGLEAARVAAFRGHQVSLYEKGPELGGQTLIAAKAPGRDGFLDLPRYQTHQMKLLNVDVHLNTEVTAEMVKEQNPDAVVVATGSIPLIPNIPGIHGDNVVEVRQVLKEEVEVGNNVVIIDGDDHMQALSTADFLAERGKKVEILNPMYYVGNKVEPATLQNIYERLLTKGVKLTPLTRVKEISGNTVIAYNVFTQEERRIEGVDTVVIAYGGRENYTLYYKLKEQVKEIYKVGDANGIRKIHNVTMDGAIVGRQL